MEMCLKQENMQEKLFQKDCLRKNNLPPFNILLGGIAGTTL